MSQSTDAAPGSSPPAEDPRSLGEIVSDVTQDLTELLRQEMELAKTELKQEVAKAGKGVGLMGGAGVAGHLFLLFVSLTVVFALDEAMPLWAAALIVSALWGIAAAVLGLTGKKAIQEANPQLPKTQRSLKEDAQWATAQKS